MSELERFVGDQLHSLIGMSDKIIVQYFIGLARKSASVGLFLQKLKETDTVTVDEKMAAFAEQVWKQVWSIAVFFFNF
jgi:pre-mRNA-splicing factor ATP-dependent RNA helicase DHX16